MKAHEVSWTGTRAVMLAALLLVCFCAGTGAASAGEIWLSPTGTGDGRDRDHPIYAGDQAAYDGVLNRHQHNWTFWYLPGTYETVGGGNRRHNVWSGQKHLAVETNRPTTIRLVKSGEGYGSIFFNLGGIDNFEVRNLIFECNATANPVFTQGLGQVSAINLNGGNNIHLSGLLIKGFGTGRAGYECFPLNCTARPRQNSPEIVTYSNISVENCVFTAPALNNKDGISVGLIAPLKDTAKFPLAPPPRLVNAYFRNCVVTNIDVPGNSFLYIHGLTAPLVEGCYFRRVREPVYFEPNPALEGLQGRWVIRGNTFCQYGGAIRVNFLPNGQMGDLLVEQNLFVPDLNGRSTVLSVSNPDHPIGNARIGNIIVTNNVVRYPDSKPHPTANNVGFHFSYARSVDIRDNIINLGNGKEILFRTPRTVGEITVANNTDSRGDLLSLRDQKLNSIPDVQNRPKSNVIRF